MALLCVNKKTALYQVDTSWPAWSTGDSVEPMTPASVLAAASVQIRDLEPQGPSMCNRPLGLQDFHGAILRALENVEQEGREPLAQEELRQGLRELPAICDLHQGILESLEQRLGDW